MQTDGFGEIPSATGDEFRPATAKLWVMLILCALIVPAGVLISYCWWFQVPLPGGRMLSSKAGIVGILAIPLGAFLTLVMAFLILTAKRLVIGADCLQLLSKDRVVVHIPFQNIAQTETTGDKDAGTVILVLRDRSNSATRVPAWTKDRFEFQCMTYGKSPTIIHQALLQRIGRFRETSA
jgi:hypothetical protein